MTDTERWTVVIPGIEPVTVFADTGGAAMDEAAAMHHLFDVPPGTTARDSRGQEFACFSATS